MHQLHRDNMNVLQHENVLVRLIIDCETESVRNEQKETGKQVKMTDNNLFSIFLFIALHMSINKLLH